MFVAQNLQTPLNTLYAWEISHALITTYHPYCHSPSALTEYLKQKLRVQRAKHLGHSPSAQVEQNVPPERNTGQKRRDRREHQGTQKGYVMHLVVTKADSTPLATVTQPQQLVTVTTTVRLT